jgi:hypothetical protein
MKKLFYFVLLVCVLASCGNVESNDSIKPIIADPTCLSKDSVVLSTINDPIIGYICFDKKDADVVLLVAFIKSNVSYSNVYRDVDCCNYVMTWKDGIATKQYLLSSDSRIINK